MAKSMMDELNRKFSFYGVIFEQCNITDVIVNPRLQEALHDKTKIKFDLQTHNKE
jgi:hypothetical protein